MAASMQRRRFLGDAVAGAALWASSSAATPIGSTPSLRLLPLRHTSALVEVTDARGLVRRVLFDPSLRPSFSMQGLFSAPEVPLREEALGPLDLVCISSGEPTSFDPRTLAALDTRGTGVLVPDDDTARRVRDLGLRRVRVVAAGDVVEVAGLLVTVSPGRGAVADAVGFHLAPRGGAGPALWHTGLLPPLEVDAQVASFASAHPADVVLGCAWGLRLRAGGPPLQADLLDATTLARLAAARVLVPVGTDARPAGVFSLVWEAAPSPSPGAITTPSSSLAPTSSLAVRALTAGAWHRLRPA